MPWQRGWPPYVSQKVLDDRRRATADLDQSSGDLKETIEHAKRTNRVADSMEEARRRNHFSESMEALFAQRLATRLHSAARPQHPRDTP